MTRLANGVPFKKSDRASGRVTHLTVKHTTQAIARLSGRKFYGTFDAQTQGHQVCTELRAGDDPAARSGSRWERCQGTCIWLLACGGEAAGCQRQGPFGVQTVGEAVRARHVEAFDRVLSEPRCDRLAAPRQVTAAGWSSQRIERYSARHAASSCARAVAQPPSRNGCTFTQT